MILHEYGKYNLYCDFCGCLIAEFDSFDEAEDYSRDEGYAVFGREGKPCDSCYECKNGRR
jgi:hypothetical protein